MTYLYLFYEDYIASSSIDPYAVISKTKEQIKQASLSKIQIRARGSLETERLFEELYSLNENRDEFANLHVQEKYQEANIILSDFDDAISKLKNLAKEGNADVSSAIILGNKIIQSIDNILILGAKTGGLAEGAVSQVEHFKMDMQEIVQSRLHFVKYKTQSTRKKQLVDDLASIQSNVSGYMLEIAHVYAFLGSHINFLGQMINIGSNQVSEYNIKNDPRIKADYEKINAALQENAGVQSKADAIFNFILNKNGQGKVSASTSWVGFQQKNVNDISSIQVGNYTLGNIGITRYYNEDFLVNIAGTLAGDQYKANIPKNLRKYDSVLSTQTYVDRIWRNLKNSTKLLGAADAIAGSEFANITNKVHYYVIRNKQTGAIKIIPVSVLLERIKAAFQKNDTDLAYGINIGKTDENTRVGNRSEYWSINVAHFDDEDYSGEKRSHAAYSLVLNKILNTKISISINFSSFF